MWEAAGNLEFEKAAQLRDRVKQIKGTDAFFRETPL
jgi:excinuclease UvrABC helicase subunit UvrB